MNVKNEKEKITGKQHLMENVMRQSNEEPAFQHIAACYRNWSHLYHRHIRSGYSHKHSRSLAYRKLRISLGLLSEYKQKRIVECVEIMEPITYGEQSQ